MKRACMFRVNPDKRVPGCYQIESDRDGMFQPVMRGLRSADIDAQLSRIKDKKRIVSDCRTFAPNPEAEVIPPPASSEQETLF